MYSKVEPFTQVNGLIKREMDTEYKNGLMVPSMKGSGRITRQKVKASFYMLTEIYLKDNGLMIKLMDLVFIFIKMALNMKDFGKMIYSTEKVLKHGLMDQSMMDTILKAKNTVKAI